MTAPPSPKPEPKKPQPLSLAQLIDVLKLAAEHREAVRR